LPDVLVDEYGWGSFSISLATFGDLGFPFLVVGWRKVPVVKVDANDLVLGIAAATFEQTTRGH
jgi:hypothetical protein